MAQIYLISPNFIRNNTNISSNTQDKFLESAIREVQDMELQEVTGTELFNKLKDLVGNNEITKIENIKYKQILDIAKYFLSYSVIARLCVISSIKIDNIGANQSFDDKVNPLTTKDIFTMESYYHNKADFYKKRLQDFLKKNREDYEELRGCYCDDIAPNLNSAFSVGISLGGARGKRIR